MTERLEIFAAAPEAMKMMIDHSMTVNSMLEHSLTELVKIRASQINRCAVCLHMHTRDARKAGISEERIMLLDAWRESSLYTPRERAALGWTDALTRLSETGAPDADYEALKAEFSPEEQIKLTMLINVINAWNRFGVTCRRAPGHYTPGQHA